MPWELGRCSIEAGNRHVDVRNVVWLGTSNIGHDMILKYQDTRECPEESASQQEYTELMGLLRPKVSEHLGVCSILMSIFAILELTRNNRPLFYHELLQFYHSFPLRVRKGRSSVLRRCTRSLATRYGTYHRRQWKR